MMPGLQGLDLFLVKERIFPVTVFAVTCTSSLLGALMNMHHALHLNTVEMNICMCYCPDLCEVNYATRVAALI